MHPLRDVTILMNRSVYVAGQTCPDTDTGRYLHALKTSYTQTFVYGQECFDLSRKCKETDKQYGWCSTGT